MIKNKTNRYQELYEICKKYFQKEKKNIFVELNDYGVTIECRDIKHGGWDDLSYEVSDLFSYCFDHEMEHTCSMNEVTGYNVEEYLEDFESSFEDLNITITAKVVLMREIFRLQFENEKYKKNSYIFNVVKNSINHKVIRGQGSWKKVFEYEGNDGTICTYMWKKN